MEITITQMVQEYGLNSILIAVVVCIFTGIIKIPIKRLASKAEDSSKYTKYITFLPLFLGFGVTVLYEYLVTKTFSFTAEFITLWLTSSSLSLAIYAFIEKFIPSKKKILSSEEIKQNQEMINQLKERLLPNTQEDATETMSGTSTETETKTTEETTTTEEQPKTFENTEQMSQQAANNPVQNKIILRGRNHD